MDKYVKLAKIGQGSFGSAFVVAKKSEPDGKKYVVKEIRVDPRDQQSALREAKLLAALDHPNIIACKESFMLPPPSVGGLFGRAAARREQVMCIVTEFADGGDLRKAMQRRQAAVTRFFQEHEVLDLFVQVCLALKHLHDRKIIHRDIKPENIFLTGANVVKLGDFGVATVLSHTLASAETLAGTPYYTSPEICLGKRYNSKTDVWSLGCVLYELATFAHPFDGRSQRQLFDNIIRASYTPVAAALAGKQTQYSFELSALIGAMLMRNPRDRPSVSSLLKTPIVMARIQRFLSERAMADELNHTVLHGHDIFRKHAALPAPPPPPRAQVSSPTPAAKVPSSCSPPPAPVANAAKRVAMVPVANKPLPPPAARPKAVLRRSRSLKKRVVHGGAKAAASPFRSPPSAKKAAPAANAVRAKAQAPVSASPLANKPAIGSKAQDKRTTPVQAPASKEVPCLPEPPPASAAIAKPCRGAVANRVAQFNAQWQAQRQELMDHIAAPPPPPMVIKQPPMAGNAYPKPVVIQVQGFSAGGSKGTSVNVKKKAVGNSRDGIRQHIRAKKKELARGPSMTPLDDPVILVQSLPDLPETAASESLPSLHEEEQQSAVVTAGEPSTDSVQAACDDAPEPSLVHPWPVPPTAENLEFERMVLQLRSVVEAANDYDEDEASEGDAGEDEGDDGDDDKETSTLKVDGASPPPPYSVSESPLVLDVEILDQDAFKRALQLAVVCVGDEARTTEALAGLPPTHHRSLLWMRDYVATVTTDASA